MIISASRRTDIPAYYSEWFFNRLKEGFVLVRNPMNYRQISRISLSPQVLDGIVFWTKNPTPMLGQLDRLEGIPSYFQFTVNAYGRDAEPNIPSKNEVIIPAFQRLSAALGRERVIWRYDPIFLSEKYTMAHHEKYFGKMAEKLAPYTEKCTVSFLDFYRNTQRNMAPLGIRPMSVAQMEDLMAVLGELARKQGICMDTCAEEIDLAKFRILHARCIDKERFERIGNYRLNIEKDPGQRAVCGCAASIDIGAYNTCKNGCLYCYANYSPGTVSANHLRHDPQSPLLFGNVTGEDVVKTRAVQSCASYQSSLF